MTETEIDNIKKIESINQDPIYSFLRPRHFPGNLEEACAISAYTDCALQFTNNNTPNSEIRVEERPFSSNADTARNTLRATLPE